MYESDLTVRPYDWGVVVIIGTLLSSLMAILMALTTKTAWMTSVIFGVTAGLCISLSAWALITLNNHLILPRLPKNIWPFVAAFFSLMSGFVGFAIAMMVVETIGEIPLYLAEHDRIVMGGLVALLSYIVGALIYLFVKMRNHKEEIHTHWVQSRLQSLQTQLNPHFLFNALNSVAELIHTDPQKAENAVIVLSRFLRHVMNEDAMITTQQELDNVQRYVALENIRFNEGITLTLQCETYDLMYKIPKFSIQLLVENAIKHGMNRSKGVLSIVIKLDRKEISVSNDGFPLTHSTWGTGLSNLQERLSFLGGYVRLSSQDPVTFVMFVGG